MALRPRYVRRLWVLLIPAEIAWHKMGSRHHGTNAGAGKSSNGIGTLDNERSSAGGDLSAFGGWVGVAFNGSADSSQA